MTRLISLAIVVLAILAGWGLFRYWESFQTDKEKAKKLAAKAVSVEQLPGMPYELQPSLEAAMRQGAKAVRYWLIQHRENVRDPRLAWIELDYCTMVARDNPAEARHVFAEVERRTPPSSPVWPRVQQLKRSLE